MSLTLREWTVVATAVMLSALLMLLGGLYVKSRTERIATIDMRAILQAKQKQVGDVLIKEGATHEMRAAAVESAAGYAVRVERVLDEILKTCHCILVSKDLVVAGRAPEDYTATVLEKLSGELALPQR